jgi:uncharacterized metal-binding protein
MDYPRCDRCGRNECRSGEELINPNCPIIREGIDKSDIVSRYLEEKIVSIYLIASKIEKESYRDIDGAITPIRPRIAEVIAFCKELGFERVGVAFCAGLIWEARKICKILENGGLDVASIMCKCFSVEKEELGLPRGSYIREGEEKGCNPLMQAEMLNRAGTELNLIVGLCIGHDILFTQHSDAPVSTLVVKDRMSGHNPISPLYSAYFSEILDRK